MVISKPLQSGMLTESFSLGFLEEYKLKSPDMELVGYTKLTPVWDFLI